MSWSRSWCLSAALAASPLLVACSRNEGSPASTREVSAAPASGRIEVAVTSEGFVPARTRVKVGQPVTLVVTRKVDQTCATEIVIKDYGINKPLPKDQAVEVTFTPTKPGPIRYACAMDMIAGELVAE